jgi:hypothetical protein
LISVSVRPFAFLRPDTPESNYLPLQNLCRGSVISERMQASTAKFTTLLSCKAVNHKSKYRLALMLAREITAISERVRLSDRPRSGSPYKYSLTPFTSYNDCGMLTRFFNCP